MRKNKSEFVFIILALSCFLSIWTSFVVPFELKNRSNSTVFANTNKSEVEKFLHEDLKGLSSQLVLLSRNGLVENIYMHLNTEPQEDFRSIPGIGDNYWYELEALKGDLVASIKEESSEQRLSENSASMLNEYLTLIEIGEGKYENLLAENDIEQYENVEGVDWLSNHRFIGEFFEVERVFLYQLQLHYKRMMNNKNNDQTKFSDERIGIIGAKCMLVSEYIFNRENFLELMNGGGDEGEE